MSMEMDCLTGSQPQLNGELAMCFLHPKKKKKLACFLLGGFAVKANSSVAGWPSLFSLHFASRPTFDSAKCKGMDDEWSRRW
jgi:hypothetical protein